VSSTLDFPVPDALTHAGRHVIIVTDRRADATRIKELEGQVGQVFVAGDDRVRGDEFVRLMADLGYRLIYSAAGPKIAHMLLTGGVLDRLYLTQVVRILGATPFSSIIDGPLLDAPADLPLLSLAYDPHAFEGVGQLLGCYGRR